MQAGYMKTWAESQSFSCQAARSKAAHRCDRQYPENEKFQTDEHPPYPTQASIPHTDLCR